jgi:hypothetical protein
MTIYDEEHCSIRVQMCALCEREKLFHAALFKVLCCAHLLLNGRRKFVLKIEGERMETEEMLRKKENG